MHHQSWKTFLSGLRGQKVTDCVRRRRWTAVSDAALVVERLEQRALLTDVTPPVVLSATPIDDQGGATFSQVKVVFDEAVSTPSATDAQKYRLVGAGGSYVAVSSAVVDASDPTGKTIILTCAPQSAGVSYGVHMGGVADLTGNASPLIGRNYRQSATLISSSPRAMTAGDFDNDGIADVVTSSNNDKQLWFHKGISGGSFATPVLVVSEATSLTRQTITSADLDGDGNLDLITPGQADLGYTFVYWGNGDGTFSAPHTQSRVSAFKAVAADMDADGDLDLVVSGGLGFSTYLNPWNPQSGTPASQATVRSFETWVSVLTLSTVNNVADLHVGDVNLDGRLDVVGLPFGNTFAQVWLGTLLPGIYLPAVSLDLNTFDLGNALADVTGDGRLDLVSGAMGAVMVGTPFSPFFAPATATGLRSDLQSVYAVDLDADGDLDLIGGRFPQASNIDPTLYISYNQGGGVFEPMAAISLGALGIRRVRMMEFRDVNGDGLVDIVGIDSSTATANFFVLKSQIGASSANFAFSPNTAPTPTAGGAYTIAEGGSLSLSAAGSTDPNGDALTYSWDVNNDGVFGDATGIAPTLTWAQLAALGIADNGNRTVAVRTTDPRGGSATSTATLTITNTAPTLAISGATTIAEGSTYVLTLSASGDAGSDTVTSWTINWGDGTSSTVSGGAVAHIYADNGNYVITATATDEDGIHPADNSVSVVVANVSPSVALVSTAASLEGSAFTQTGTITDVGTGDTWTATVDYGDGSGVQTLAVNGNSFSLNHVFANTGTYTVVVRVTDDDGGEGTATVLVTVTNVTASSVALSGPSAGNANQVVVFGAIPSVTGSPSENYSSQWTLSRNGIVIATSIDTSFSFSAAFGTYTIHLTLTDDEGNITNAIAATYTVAKATTDVNADMIGYAGGVWTVASSTGSAFSTANWADWGDVAGASVTTGDFNGDGLTDVVRLENGKLFVGISNGSSSFSRSQWADLGPGAWSQLMSGDVNGDGRADLVTRLGTGWYVSLSTGTSFAPVTLWAGWSSNVNWQDVSLVDLDNNGQADLLGRNGAVWWAAKSNGSAFVGTASWPAFASATAWDAFFVRDLNNDGFVDVLGKAAGEWWVSISNAGLSFTNNAAALWAGWSSAVQWKDARVGDFNGDNYADITARHPLSGNWFVALGTGTAFGPASVWTNWSSSANWQDVRVGDFNGDGKDDLVARLNGNLHVSTAATGSFNTIVPWTTGWAAAFSYVASAKLTGTPAAPAAAPIASAPAGRGVATVSKSNSLALFWSSTKDDERFAAALLSSSRA